MQSPSRRSPAPAGIIAETLSVTRAALTLSGIAVEESRMEAELLLRHALGWDAAQLYSSLREQVPAAPAALLERLVARRRRREPLAYIVGQTEFCGRMFRVDPQVLIPRPETELLVERALAAAAEMGRQGTRVADIGTGSGVLAITLALELPDARVDATDSSASALEVAMKNAIAHGVEDRVSLLPGSLATPLTERYEILVANLPYVATGRLSDLEPELSFEPVHALDGGPDGVRFLRLLIQDLPRLLSAPGVAILEIDPPIEAAARSAVRAALPLAGLSVLPDLAGHARCLEIVNS